MASAFETNSLWSTGARPLSRRTLLRSAGAGIALPLLDAMVPRRACLAATAAPSRRLLAIHVPLGLMPQFFFPAKVAAVAGAAAGVPSSPYLDLLAEHRGQFTVFSGMSHPGVDGNHHAAQCFLTGAPHPGSPSFRNSLSLDQVAAEKIGGDTRFPSLTLSLKTTPHYSDSISVSRSGVEIPPESSAQQR